MPRYLVERTFPDGLNIPIDDEGAATCLTVVGRNADKGVAWIHSYVSKDKQQTFCVYDGPDPESIRRRPRATASRSTRSGKSASSTRTSTRRRKR